MNNYFPSRDAFQHGRYSEIPEESEFGSPEFAKVETPGLQIWQSPTSRSTTWHSPSNRLSTASLSSIRTLRDPDKSRFWDYFFIVCTVLPGLFFVFLALSMIGLQGKDESSFGQFIMQVTQVAPTLWPIGFAAIIGMMIRAWAHQKLENGTTVGVLEQLGCSQTVLGVLRGVWITRTFNWYTLILVLVWILSPLGGQASLRILYQQQHTNTTTGSVSYADIRVVDDSDILYLFDSNETRANFPLLRSIYGSVLTHPGAATQYADGSSKYFGKMVERLGGLDHAASSLTQDLWLNPRVPRLETMYDFNPMAPGRWLTVGNHDGLTNYSSLLGVPIRGIPALFDGNMTFTVNSSYHNFYCSEWMTNNDEIADWMSVNYDRFEFWPSHPGYESWSDSLRVNMTNLDEGYMGFWVDTLKPTDEDIQSDAQTEIVFGSLNGLNRFASVDQTSVDITTCRVNVTHVQVMMECVKLGSSTGHQSCRASQIRANPAPPLNAKVNAFQPINMTTIIAQYWPRLVYMQRSNPWPSITQQFLDDPGVLLTGDPYLRQSAQLGLLSPELFSYRLSLVWNSFYMAVVDPVLILGGDNGKSSNWTLVPVEARFDASQPLQYALYPGWLIVYMFATAVLVGATVATVILRMNMKGPEILGYVSSLMRDSRFTEKGARAGSALSGDDRSRLLKSVRVKLMDVEGDRDVGRIAFTEIDGYNGTQKRRLREDRMYS